MTSNINYLSINENFPVAGEDNDTQTFRDNFDTIKTSLRAGQEEITTLQANTAGLQLVETENGSDFGGREISNVTLRNTLIKSYGGGIIPGDVTTLTVDYENGGYQKFQFAGNIDIDFQNFPDNITTGGLGKVVLELYSQDGFPKNVVFRLSGSTKFRLGGVTSGITRTSDVQISFTITSNEFPKIFEIWRYDSNFMFVNYLGNFS